MQVKPPDTRETAVADENHDANIGRWTTWTERDPQLAARIPLGAPACLAELQRDHAR